MDRPTPSPALIAEIEAAFRSSSPLAKAWRQVEDLTSEEVSKSTLQVDSPAEQVVFSQDTDRSPASPGADPRTCPATTKSGEGCNASPLKDAEHCFFHSPLTAHYQDETRRRGNHASAISRRPTAKDIHPEAFSLLAPTAIQVVLDAIVRLELTGRIAPSRTKNILRALSIAVRNYEIGGKSGDSIAHQSGGYIQTREMLDDFLEDLCHSADIEDAGRQAQIISNATSLKRSLLQAIEQFTPERWTGTLKERLLAQEPFPPSPFQAPEAAAGPQAPDPMTILDKMFPDDDPWPPK